jgi:hypothetical protein
MNMPQKILMLAVSFGVMGIATSPLAAAGYSKAEITRLFNDVKVLKENAAAKEATVGLQINPVTSVATGAGSRAELRFPDQSLTRLGANSRFTLRGDERTLDLEKGVMLLQVPEQIRGAKVRTAAVTAAVTGGTALLEYLPGGYIKLIVIEGFVDIVQNGNPSNFKQFGAGKMLIVKESALMKPGATIPDGVDVDLKALLQTSKLLSGNDKDSINQDLVNNAVQQQQELIQSGQLQPTNLVIPGQGTYVVINTDNSQLANIFNNFEITNGDPPPPEDQPAPQAEDTPPPPNGNDASFHGFAPMIAGKSILNEGATVRTHPHLDGAYNLRGDNLTQLENAPGILYRGLSDEASGRLGDGLLQYFIFGDTNILSSNLQPKINDPKPGNNNGYWAVFKFEDLFINGTPVWETSDIFRFIALDSEPVLVTNVVLASQNGIRVGHDALFPNELPPPDSEGAENGRRIPAEHARPRIL